MLKPKKQRKRDCRILSKRKISDEMLLNIAKKVFCTFEEKRAPLLIVGPRGMKDPTIRCLVKVGYAKLVLPKDGDDNSNEQIPDSGN